MVMEEVIKFRHRHTRDAKLCATHCRLRGVRSFPFQDFTLEAFVDTPIRLLNPRKVGEEHENP